MKVLNAPLFLQNSSPGLSGHFIESGIPNFRTEILLAFVVIFYLC